MELLISSHYKYPSVVIDVCKHMNIVSDIVKVLLRKQAEKEKLEKDICSLERQLYVSMRV